MSTIDCNLPMLRSTEGSSLTLLGVFFIETITIAFKVPRARGTGCPLEGGRTQPLGLHNVCLLFLYFPSDVLLGQTLVDSAGLVEYAMPDDPGLLAAVPPLASTLIVLNILLGSGGIKLVPTKSNHSHPCFTL